MANVRRRKPVGGLGDPSLGGDLPVGAERGSVGLPAEDPSELGMMGDPMAGDPGGGLGMLGTDAVPTDGLAMLGGGEEMGLEGGAVDDEEIAALEAALQDPTTDPATKQQIQQILAEAARRSLAGVGV